MVLPLVFLLKNIARDCRANNNGYQLLCYLNSGFQPSYSNILLKEELISSESIQSVLLKGIKGYYCARLLSRALIHQKNTEKIVSYVSYV